jgi:hypothetical protein
MAKYQKRYHCFPLKIPRGPCTGLVSKDEELHLEVTPPSQVPREHPANRWISDKTWAAINKQAMMKRQGHLTTLVTGRMGHKIKSLLTADCKQCAANAASTIESHLGNGDMKEAWRTLQGWCRLAEDRPPPAGPETMVKQTAKCMELYARVSPMGAALPFNLLHFKISNDMPTDSEVQLVVRGLKNGQAAGATGMKAKHLNGWLDKIQHRRKQPGRTLA